jgi:hypothetical protein
LPQIKPFTSAGGHDKVVVQGSLYLYHPVEADKIEHNSRIKDRKLLAEAIQVSGKVLYANSIHSLRQAAFAGPH